MIPINLAVEDGLSEATLRRLLSAYGGPWAIGTVYSAGGVGYLRRMINGFNNAARGTPFIVLADLDDVECAPELVATWLPHAPHANLILRVAVREIESWVLADSQGIAQFLRVSRPLVPIDVDRLKDPKKSLVKLAARGRRREVQRDVVPSRGSTAEVGRNYNARMQAFVGSEWNPERARVSSPSLERAINALVGFAPSWEE